MHYLDTLLAYISVHSALTYGAIFLVSVSESLAMVGLLVPGTFIMFGVGAIVATGSLDLATVLMLAMAGAIVGDGASYWLGHFYKEKLASVRPFSSHPEMLEKAADFFHRHGGKSVLFGRFVGPLRPVIPVVAGMLGMRPVHFAIVNVLSAIGWALVYILPGVFFGASLAVAGAVSTRLAVLIFIVVAGIWAFVWLCRKVLYLFEHKGPAWLSALGNWATAQTSSRGFIRRIKHFIFFLFFSKKGEELLFGFLVLVFLAAGWGFLGVLQDVIARDPLVVADHAIYNFLQSLRTPWADTVFVTITELGDSFVNLSLTCVVLALLLFRRCRRAAGFWMLTVLGGLMSVLLLKWAIHLPRPVDIYHGAAAFGFPSGHTTMSITLYGFLAILMARQLADAWRWGLFSGVMLVAFVIGFSRLYLGAHWLSDVLGGYFIGMSWVAFLGIAYMKGQEEPIPRRLLGTAVIAVLIISGGWHVAQNHEKDMSLYKPIREVQAISLTAWLANGWSELPAYRIDLAGEREQPLTIQWSGTPEVLARSLSAGRWQQAPSLSLRDFLGIFRPDIPVEKLPVLPLLHNGRVEVLRLVQKAGDHRWVLRLWPGNAKISENGSHLFVGTIEVQDRRRLVDLVYLARDSGEYDLPLTALEPMFRDHFMVKPVYRKLDETLLDDELVRLRWHGKVLLIRQL